MKLSFSPGSPGGAGPSSAPAWVSAAVAGGVERERAAMERALHNVVFSSVKRIPRKQARERDLVTVSSIGCAG